MAAKSWTNMTGDQWRGFAVVVREFRLLVIGLVVLGLAAAGVLPVRSVALSLYADARDFLVAESAASQDQRSGMSGK